MKEDTFDPGFVADVYFDTTSREAAAPPREQLGARFDIQLGRRNSTMSIPEKARALTVHQRHLIENRHKCTLARTSAEIGSMSGWANNINAHQSRFNLIVSHGR